MFSCAVPKRTTLSKAYKKRLSLDDMEGDICGEKESGLVHARVQCLCRFVDRIGYDRPDFRGSSSHSPW